MSTSASDGSATHASVAATDDGYQGASASRPLEIVFAVVALGFTAGYLFLATQIPLRREAAPGQIDARFWPLVIGVTGVVIAIALLAVAITRPAPTREDLERIQPGGYLRVIATLAITGAFIALWSLGSVILFGYRIEVFPIAAALLMAALMLLYGHRRWLSLVIYSVSVTAFVYVVFGMLLRIPL
ncbi:MULTISPECIES: tripartite tricarboxylate transporter TctB family protein [unclassified Microbacterium]|uniref:tripartite tricarboxylate transporter TctB family protein n=1 Tax=unclassified Microbacterium TaxID=2609290 RepID=UPI00049373FB|nr:MULTISPECIES: tripartite tricarboxylate transporter TctB family protein [unclassified Microbacterium]MCV0334692.1 tripartite tricarboxylate transporter TctB family protein [Microbacterium sp.]MCV0374129.1 tripartite tricarboxylate transporter TctB family protein [Microbacterium sp.]MCV0391339.1 tripartite tricarboxylate transporter TctB family protein [Microbacterium sp.]MCV0418735.1 tripartite tricarboxylate transporter TctB family protein [Microbacterium sp.]MCV0423180.1 tripartite tricar